MKHTVYLVTFDGYNNYDGSEIYLLGIYSNREVADKAADKFKEEFIPNVQVREVILDHTYSVETGRWIGFSSQIYLGGYIE